MLKVSKMTGKLEGFHGVNFSSVCNLFCLSMAQDKKTVCSHCYSQKMLRTFRKGAEPTFARNASFMSVLRSEEELPSFMPGSYVRFLAHGELESATQAQNMLRLCKKNPSSFFALWTKRPYLVEEAVNAEGGIPENLVLIQSVSMLNPKVVEKHPMFHATFAVFDKAHVQEDTESSWACNGKKCSTCMHCYTKNRVVERHSIVEVLR